TAGTLPGAGDSLDVRKRDSNLFLAYNRCFAGQLILRQSASSNIIDLAITEQRQTVHDEDFSRQTDGAYPLSLGAFQQRLIFRFAVFCEENKLFAFSHVGKAKDSVMFPRPAPLPQLFDRCQRDHSPANLGETLGAAKNPYKPVLIDADKVAGVIPSITAFTRWGRN